MTMSLEPWLRVGPGGLDAVRWRVPGVGCQAALARRSGFLANGLACVPGLLQVLEEYLGVGLFEGISPDGTVVYSAVVQYSILTGCENSGDVIYGRCWWVVFCKPLDRR
jgi:hypothetical protein